ETGKNYLRKIIVKYQDLISGGNATDTESLEIPLVVFNEADQIISCILLIAEEQGIPFEKVLL
ncbi:MAG TPA: hypothetical protein VFF14_01510, partial [Candidatus Deferrimicrobium sp.]|nr:hypothetical protein [Candidatus Deferrimicrobium sp.]